MLEVGGPTHRVQQAGTGQDACGTGEWRSDWERNSREEDSSAYRAPQERYLEVGSAEH